MEDDEISQWCYRMERCFFSDESSEIDMSKVNKLVSEFSAFSDYDKSSIIAWCCGQLSGHRRRLDKGEGKIGVTKEEKREILMAFLENVVDDYTT